MSDAPRLHTELLGFLFNVGLVTTTAVLSGLFSSFDFLERAGTTGRRISADWYLAAIGQTAIDMVIAIFLALLWHAPRILGANLKRQRRWFDRKLANAIFALSTITSQVLATMASRKCFFQNNSYGYTDPNIQFGLGPALCRANEDMIWFSWTIFGILFVFAICYAFYLTWIGWNARRASQ